MWVAALLFGPCPNPHLLLGQVLATLAASLGFIYSSTATLLPVSLMFSERPGSPQLFPQEAFTPCPEPLRRVSQGQEKSPARRQGSGQSAGSAAESLHGLGGLLPSSRLTSITQNDTGDACHNHHGNTALFRWGQGWTGGTCSVLSSLGLLPVLSLTITCLCLSSSSQTVALQWAAAAAAAAVTVRNTAS